MDTIVDKMYKISHLLFLTIIKELFIIINEYSKKGRANGWENATG